MSTTHFNALVAIMARAFNMTPEQWRAEAEALAAKRRARVARQNAAYDEALTRVTHDQAKTIARLHAEGARVWSKLRQHRASGNVVIFLDAQKFNHAKMRMGSKLYAVYPDGSHTETFEKSISVRRDF